VTKVRSQNGQTRHGANQRGFRPIAKRREREKRWPGDELHGVSRTLATYDPKQERRPALNAEAGEF